MQGLNSDNLAIYQTGTGTEWPCLVSTALKNPLQDLKKKSLCFDFLWISSNAGRQTLSEPIFVGFNIVK